jgi:hypothetical protein
MGADYIRYAKKDKIYGIRLLKSEKPIHESAWYMYMFLIKMKVI